MACPLPPDGWKHAAVDRSGVVVFTVGGWDFLPPLLWGRVRFPVCLLVFLACRRGVGVGMPPPPLPLSLAVGVSPSDFLMHTRPRAPALLRHRGARLGSAVQSSPVCSETSPSLLFWHRAGRHRISKEAARSEAEPEGRPASALSTEPLPWDSDQRTPGPGAWHCRKQSSGRPPSLPPFSLSGSPRRSEPAESNWRPLSSEGILSVCP